MRLNVGFCLLGAFIGEFIAADRGLGYRVMQASGLYQVPRALAAAIGISVIALVFDRCAALVENQRHVLVQMISVPSAIRPSLAGTVGRTFAQWRSWFAGWRLPKLR